MGLAGTLLFDDGSRAGDVVNITNAGVYPDHSTILNGFFKITAVEPGSDPSWFEYEVKQDPGSLAGDFAPGYYGRMWGLDWCLVEGNIIELNIRTMGPIGFNQPVAIFMYGGGVAPNYRMHQLVIRDNLIRNIDNRSDPNRATPNYGSFAEGIRMKDASLAENALWQNNIVRLDRDEIGPASMTFLGSSLRTFDNNSPEGTLISAKHRVTLEAAPEVILSIQAATQDVLIAAFFK